MLTFQVPGAAFPQSAQIPVALSVILEIRLGFPWSASEGGAVTK